MHDFQWRTLLLAVPFLLGCTLGRVTADEPGSKPQENVKKAKEVKGAKELSVAPLDHIVYPKDRPTWISDPVKQEGNETTFVVVSGPSDTRDQSLQDLKLMRRAALSNYIGNVTGTFGSTDFYKISDQRIDRDLSGRRYSGELTVGGTTQYEDAVEIRVAESERKLMLDASKNIEVSQRLATLGVATLGGFITLVVSSTAIGIAVRRRERK